MTLPAIRARLNAAYPGRWKIKSFESGEELLIVGKSGPGWYDCIAEIGQSSSGTGAHDAALIAHAPSDLGFLLARVEQLIQAGEKLAEEAFAIDVLDQLDAPLATWRSAVAALDQEEAVSSSDVRTIVPDSALNASEGVPTVGAPELPTADSLDQDDGTQ